MKNLYAKIKEFLDSLPVSYQVEDDMFIFSDKRIIITPISLVDKREYNQTSNTDFETIHIYQDRWESDNCNLKQRIKARLGIYKNIFARKCEVRHIKARELINTFLKENHPYGAVRAKYNYALFYNDQMIAVATFSAPRPLPRRIDNPYINIPKEQHELYDIIFVHSFEWLRFATLPDIRVVGGMGKLLSAFISHIKENGILHNYEVMTYSDNEWSSGKGYIKLGFKYCGDRAAVPYYVEKKSNQRLSVNEASKIKNFRNEDYIKITNCGSKKFILSQQLLKH